MESAEALSWIRDITLAGSGREKIDWVWQNMPVLGRIARDFSMEKPFEGMNILLCLHLEAKSACLGLAMQAGGARVIMAASNPLSTQDDVCAAMVEAGLTVFARYGASPEEYDECHRKALDAGVPDLYVDDGSDVTTLLHRDYPHYLPTVLGGCEETTTGIQRLRAMAKDGALKIPVVAVNDARMKHLFDNRYGTGQSVWDAIMSSTNLVVAGKTVVVAGYGWCGKGVSMRAKGLGAEVIITEIDPVKALEAMMDGFQVMSMDQAASLGDYFITVTGVSDIIIGTHMEKMKDGAILANAGHFDVEISLPDLSAFGEGPLRVKPSIDMYRGNDGKRLYLMGEGRLVNLACGYGHPAEVMDTSFALQALCLLYLKEHNGKLENDVLPVPKGIDDRIAGIKLSAAGLSIDTLSPEQEKYRQSWVV
ncbi:MAG: adenosylhomocysteinase [Peptococcaceae bacterium]|nr:adenosylhomocysteinase [Peptococcaceae bacterium]